MLKESHLDVSDLSMSLTPQNIVIVNSEMPDEPKLVVESLESTIKSLSSGKNSSVSVNGVNYLAILNATPVQITKTNKITHLNFFTNPLT